jgi:hypothetical protein
MKEIDIQERLYIYKGVVGNESIIIINGSKKERRGGGGEDGRRYISEEV